MRKGWFLLPFYLIALFIRFGDNQELEFNVQIKYQLPRCTLNKYKLPRCTLKVKFKRQLPRCTLGKLPCKKSVVFLTLFKRGGGVIPMFKTYVVNFV